MNRVIHFELSVENAEKSIPFYSEVFGWKVEKMGWPHQLLAGLNR